MVRAQRSGEVPAVPPEPAEQQPPAVAAEPAVAATRLTPLERRAAIEREDRQRGMNALQVLFDDARHHPDGTVKVTQQRLAELTGWTRGRVQYILRGKVRTAPPKDDLLCLAKFLELDDTQVMRAAAQVYGWNLYATRDAKMELLVATASPLSDRDLQAVQAVAEALLRAQD